MQKVLIIGGHGTLGRPVVRCLIADGFEVRALARDPDRAWKRLPPEVEVVKGDLRDLASIREAADGCNIVHLNLSTPNHKAAFLPELDGTHQIIKALADRPEVVLSKITAYGSRPTNGWWPDIDHKFYTEHAIMASGHPWLIWRPTWFFESIPLFIRKKTLMQPIADSPPLYWVTGHDFGRWIARAFADDSLRNRFFYAQGAEAMTFGEAFRRFRDTYDPSLKIRTMPSFLPAIGALFNPKMHHIHRLLQDAAVKVEEMRSADTYKLLGPPTMGIEQYVEYMHTTGDIPTMR